MTSHDKQYDEKNKGFFYQCYPVTAYKSAMSVYNGSSLHPTRLQMTSSFYILNAIEQMFSLVHRQEPVLKLNYQSLTSGPTH